MKNVPVATLKSRLSEFIAKSAYGRERFIITRRNKPVAALVNLEDLRLIEQQEEQQGLVSVIGKWKGFEEVEEAIRDLSSIRKSGGVGRDVSF